MAWTTPRTWSAGEVLSASLLNTHLRDNLNYLLSGRVYTQSTYVGVANASTTSTTFSDVDATNVIVSVTPKSNRARVIFHFLATSASGTGAPEFDIYSVTAAARLGDSTHGLIQTPASGQTNVTLHAVATGLTPGSSNSFKLQFRDTTSGQTATVLKNGVPITMFVEEF